MRNELLLIATLLIEYSAVVLAHRFLGKTGLYVWIAVATVLANIEVMILVHAFGIDMTLGNILFASTFLVTDILSEIYGERAAKKGVLIGITSALAFTIISISWLAYIPAEGDVTSGYIHGLFSFTPRIVAASIIVYVIVQLLDVFLYHRIWKATTECEDSSRGLWIRNNCATIISQIINAVLYNILAFAGIYSGETLVSIIISSLIISIITSIADTPFLYIARKWAGCCHEKC